MGNGNSRSRESRQWFKMHPQDFLASPRVGRMDAEERGVYITILLRSWTEDGYAMDECDLADELDMVPTRLVEILDGRVGRCFDVDDVGVWRNGRLEEERAAAVRKRSVAVTSGRKGGQAKARNSQANATEDVAPLSSGQTPSVSASVSASVSDTPQSPETSQSHDPPTPQGGELSLADNELAQTKSAHNLAAAIDRGLQPVAPSLRQALEAWAEHELEAGKPAPGVRAWMTRVGRALKAPEQFVRDVAYSIGANWKNVRTAPAEHDYGDQRAFGLFLNDYLRLSKEDQARVKMAYDDQQSGVLVPVAGLMSGEAATSSRLSLPADTPIGGPPSSRAGRSTLDVTPNTNPSRGPVQVHTDLAGVEWDVAFEEDPDVR